MPSSFAVCVRAAVMLGVLIVLPAYALLGTALPDKLLPLVDRLVSWEEASPRPPQNLSLRHPPEDIATVRVRDDGRRVLLSDRFAELERALREVGAIHFTVSVENSRRSPSYWCSCQVVDRRDRFEAAAANALGAMEAVLRQIRAWRSAGESARR